MSFSQFYKYLPSNAFHLQNIWQQKPMGVGALAQLHLIPPGLMILLSHLFKLMGDVFISVLQMKERKTGKLPKVSQVGVGRLKLKIRHSHCCSP